MKTTFFTLMIKRHIWYIKKSFTKSKLYLFINHIIQLLQGPSNHSWKSSFHLPNLKDKFIQIEHHNIYTQTHTSENKMLNLINNRSTFCQNRMFNMKQENSMYHYKQAITNLLSSKIHRTSQGYL